MKVTYIHLHPPDGHAGTVARALELVRFAREELLVGHLRIVYDASDDIKPHPVTPAEALLV